MCPAAVMGAVPPASGAVEYTHGMPLSAQKRSLASASAGCRSALVGSPYMMKYGLARSSASPPRSSPAICHIAARSRSFSATTTGGFVVFITMARKLSSSATCGSRSPGCA